MLSDHALPIETHECHIISDEAQNIGEEWSKLGTTPCCMGCLSITYLELSRPRRLSEYQTRVEQFAQKLFMNNRTIGALRKLYILSRELIVYQSLKLILSQRHTMFRHGTRVTHQKFAVAVKLV